MEKLSTHLQLQASEVSAQLSRVESKQRVRNSRGRSRPGVISMRAAKKQVLFPTTNGATKTTSTADPQHSGTQNDTLPPRQKRLLRTLAAGCSSHFLLKLYRTLPEGVGCSRSAEVRPRPHARVGACSSLDARAVASARTRTMVISALDSVIA